MQQVFRSVGNAGDCACVLSGRCVTSEASVESGRKMAAAILEGLGKDFLTVMGQ